MQTTEHADTKLVAPLLPQLPKVESPASLPRRTVRLIMVVEGGGDIRALKRFSRVLHQADPGIPDLKELEQAGTLLFLPTAGSNLCFWTDRLAGLGISELHVYDRETPPVFYERQAAAALVNLRPGCRAFVTSKRALENYLDPQAIYEARGVDVEFGDQDDVPKLVACQILQRSGGAGWSNLPLRARRRLIASVKGWLNTEAASLMTVERLAARDPAGEIRSWMAAITAMTCG